VALAPGDAVLLLSDGVFEARSPAGDFFGWERMVTHVHSALRSGVRAPEVLRLLIREVIDFQGDDVRDDATLVIVRWEPDAAGAPTAPSAAHARTR
jgi:serine phosphatase RsbU (regulator of sigma subunit)